jgi:WD40 repeat protein
VRTNYDNDIRLWNTESGELIAKGGDPTGTMFGAEFTPDGQQLIVAGLDETQRFTSAMRKRSRSSARSRVRAQS